MRRKHLLRLYRNGGYQKYKHIVDIFLKNCRRYKILYGLDRTGIALLFEGIFNGDIEMYLDGMTIIEYFNYNHQGIKIEEHTPRSKKDQIKLIQWFLKHINKEPWNKGVDKKLERIIKDPLLGY